MNAYNRNYEYHGDDHDDDVEVVMVVGRCCKTIFFVVCFSSLIHVHMQVCNVTIMHLSVCICVVCMTTWNVQLCQWVVMVVVEW